MRALLLFVICVVVGCATVQPTGVQDRGDGFYRIVDSVPEGQAASLSPRVREVGGAFCEAQQGRYIEISGSGVEPTIDFSGRDSVDVCFRCTPLTGEPPDNYRRAAKACGFPYRWPIIGYR